jgi:AcrR family transcriptional regulator
LIAAAARLFNSYGYHGTDSNRIAHAAGYSTGIFYKHFKNKREVFLAAYETWSKAEWAQFAAIVTSGGSNRDAARRLVTVAIGFHTSWRGLLSSLRALVFSDPVVRKFHRSQRRKQLDWMAELRRKRGTLPHRKEEDLIHLYTTERTYDAIAQGDISALGLKRKFFIEAMVQNVIAALH